MCGMCHTPNASTACMNIEEATAANRPVSFVLSPPLSMLSSPVPRCIALERIDGRAHEFSILRKGDQVQRRAETTTGLIPLGVVRRLLVLCHLAVAVLLVVRWRTRCSPFSTKEVGAGSRLLNKGTQGARLLKRCEGLSDWTSLFACTAGPQFAAELAAPNSSPSGPYWS